MTCIRLIEDLFVEVTDDDEYEDEE